MYRKLSQPGRLLSSPEHTGLILNTDGAPIFKSASHSLWPIYLCVTSFPPEIRMNVKNLILAGVWFAPVKPDMAVILDPILEKIKLLEECGISVETSNGSKTVKACLFMAVFDLPALAMACNTTQYNGKYGCLYCLDEGVHISGTHVYPPDDDHQLRTSSQQRQWAEEAERTGRAVYGVKGTSVLSDSIDIQKQCPVDYMHAVLEGVTKKLMQKYWFNSKQHGKRFYLLKEVNKIDKCLQRIKPPHDFRSTPRSISKALHFWKASEYQAFLLYYAIPVLKCFLPSDYIYHLALLVCSMHLLLGTDITTQDIDQAEAMLQKFYILAPKLYSLQMCSSVTHSLIHIPQFVRTCGPLWSYSMFGYENMNGHLKTLVHGTRNVLDQLVFSYQVKRALPLLGRRLEDCEESPQTVRYIQEHKAVETGSQIGNNTFIIGKVKHRKVDMDSQTSLIEAGARLIEEELPVFYRIKKNNTVYHSQLHSKRPGARNSTICMFVDPSTGAISFGSIKLFCFAMKTPVTVVQAFEKILEAPLADVRTPQLRELQSGYHFTALQNVIHGVKKPSLSSRTVAIPVSNIISKCVLIPVKYSSIDYVIPQPNMLEHL